MVPVFRHKMNHISKILIFSNSQSRRQSTGKPSVSKHRTLPTLPSSTRSLPHVSLNGTNPALTSNRMQSRIWSGPRPISKISRSGVGMMKLFVEQLGFRRPSTHTVLHHGELDPRKRNASMMMRMRILRSSISSIPFHGNNIQLIT